jgi:CHASE2 domain-containing sensor protein
VSIVRSLKVTLLRVVGGGAGVGEAERKWSWPEFGGKLVRALPYIAITIMLVSWMEDAGWLRGFETSHLDAMIRAQPFKLSQDIVVVEISKDDYHKLFEGTSPLDEWKLLDVIGAVLKYNPAVIGVDIDTNDWLAACNRRDDEDSARCAEDRARLTKRLSELRAKAKASGTVIVWAAVPKTPDPPLELNSPLGSLPLDSDKLGMPRFPVDEDGSVRHFDGRVEVTKEGGGGCPGAVEDGKSKKCYLKTFARAIYEAYTGYSAEVKKDESVIFNFHGDRYQFPAIDSGQLFRETAKTDDPRSNREIGDASSTTDETRKALIGREGRFSKGKVVLIGGAFPEARDEYFTPVGPMEGVKLNALAIQTDLGKRGIMDLSKIGEYFIDWGVSIGLVFLFYRCENHPVLALFISGFVIPVALIASWILFNSFAYWFNFIPVAVGVVIHQFSDMTEGRVRVQHGLEKLKQLRREQERVEIAVVTVEELAVSEIGEAGPVDSIAENTKAKGAASGAG